MSYRRHIESIEQDPLFVLTGKARAIGCTNVAHFEPESNLVDWIW